MKLKKGTTMKAFLSALFCALGLAVFSEPLADGYQYTEVVGDYTWSFSVANGKATIGVKSEYGYDQWQRAVEPYPYGEVEIPSELGGCPVTGIGCYAFHDCSQMTSVTIPSSVTSIGDYAFEYSGLTAVTIPASVTSIGSLAFGWCQSLASFAVEAGNANYKSENDCLLTKNGKALVAAPNVESVTVPEGVELIGSNAFAGHYSLVSVELPSTLREIGEYAFQNCYNMEGVELPKSLESIDSGAFYDCAYLTEVTIPASVRYIGYQAFDTCSQLATVTFEGDKSKIEIGANAFRGTPYAATLPFAWIIDGTTLVGFEGTPEAEVEIPSGVTTIGNSVFANCAALEKVTIPVGVSSIEWDAFRYCTGLKEVSLPESLRTIGGSAFLGTALETVELPASLQQLDYSAFNSVTSLTAVYFRGNAPGTVSDSIYQNSFNVTNYVREGSVGWNGAGSTELPDYWPTAGGAYNGRPIMRWAGEPAITHQVTFDLGEHVTRTGGGDLEQTVVGGTAAVAPTVTAESGWAFVGWDADFDCVTEDMTVRALYGREDAYADGSYTDTVDGYTWSFVISNGMATIKSPSNWSEAVEPYPYGEVEIPAELGGWPVRAIGEYAFYFCSQMTAVKIPETVNRIGYYAFYGCSSLKTVTIPASVTFVDYAFNCSELSSVFFLGNAPATSSEGVFGWDTYATCFVRKGTTGWSAPGSSVLPEAWPLVGYTSPQTIREWTTYPDVCYRVTFDLGEGAVRAGGGELEQFVREGEDAVAPTLALNPGYEFVGWDSDFAEVQGKLFVNARYKKDGKLTDGYEYTEEANGYIWMFDIYEGEALISKVVRPTPSGAVTIPSELGGWPVTEIGARVFENCRQMTSVTIPESVILIGDYAFRWSGLTSVTIPAGVEDISAYAFQSCSSLTSIDVAADNEEYSSANGCLLTKDGKTLVLAPHAATVTVPEGVEVIGERAFASHGALTAVELPSSLREIGDEAFASCYNLGSITLPQGLERIGEWAFDSCGFNSIIIPASVNYIGAYAFSTSWTSWLSIWYEGDCPKVDEYAYGNIWKGCSYVRSGAKGWDLQSDTWLGLPIKVWETWPDIGWEVTFDLGEYGTRTGGGELKQFVLDGGDAVAPEVTADDGFEFYGWDCPFTGVTDPLTVRAFYTKGGQPFGWIPLNDVDIIDLSDYEGEWLYECGVLSSRYLEPAEFDVDEETGVTVIGDYDDLWIEAEITKRGFLTFEYRVVDTNGTAVAAKFDPNNWDWEGPAIIAGVGEESGWQPVRMAVDNYLSLVFVNRSSSRCRVEIRNLKWEEPPEYVTVKLDPKLGQLPDGQPAELRLRTDGTFGELPVPVCENREFLCWCYVQNYEWGELDPDMPVPICDMTLIAEWDTDNVPLESVVNPSGELKDLSFDGDWWGVDAGKEEPFEINLLGYFIANDSAWREYAGYSDEIRPDSSVDVFSATFERAGELMFEYLEMEMEKEVGDHYEYCTVMPQVLIDGNPVAVAMEADGSAKIQVDGDGQHRLTIRMVNDMTDQSCWVSLNLGAISFSTGFDPIDENTYKVTFDPNGGAGTMAPQLFTNGVAQALATNGFTFAEKLFAGWATNASTAAVYADGAVVSNLTTAGGTFALFATWTDDPAAKRNVPLADPTPPKAEDLKPVETPDQALSYSGYVTNGVEIAGLITVKVTKKGAVTATVQLPEGTKLAKTSYKGNLGEGGMAELVCSKNGGKMSVQVCEGLVSGEIEVGDEKYGFTARSSAKDVLADLDGFNGKVWTVALKTAPANDLAVQMNGYSVLSVAGGKKGKMKVSGVLADGTKVSLTAQGMAFGDSVVVPVVYQKKTTAFSLKLLLKADGAVQVGNVSDWTSGSATATWEKAIPGESDNVNAEAKFALGMDVKDVIETFGVVDAAAGKTSILPNGVPVKAVDASSGKWTLPKAGKVAFVSGSTEEFDEAKFTAKSETVPNPAALKLAFKKKTGLFSGSFQFYQQSGTKLKKLKATVNGAVVKGVGYGSATVKNKGALPVTVGK